jgi:hypothetical protein
MSGISNHDEYEALLHNIWWHHDRRSDPWLADRLNFFGRDPNDFGSS